MRNILPVVTVFAVIVALWYGACAPMNIAGVLTEAERAGAEVSPPDAKARRNMSTLVLVAKNTSAIPRTWAQERPRLPAPHQVAVELWDTTVIRKITSKRSLVYHGWITLSATLLGFAIGTVLGIVLAVGIVHSRVMDMSVMPWAIVSQTIPIITLAPMIIVVMYSVGIQGIIPKAVISAYLSFFSGGCGYGKRIAQPRCNAT